MEEDKASLTALITAFARAYHSANADPKIFDDFLAARWFTPEGWKEMETNLANSLPFFNPELAKSTPDTATALAIVMRDYIGTTTISRSQYTEERLEAEVEKGVRQYVILGAGIDTFAFRRPDLLEHIDIFEIDHPATQAFKRERLADLGWEIPRQLHFLPVDFSKESFMEALDRSPFERSKPTFFSWLGVTVYLTREVVFDTLRAISGFACSGSPVVFDYYDADAFDPEKATERVRLGMEIARRAGEPMKTGFEPSQLAADLREIGLRVQEDLGPFEIEEHYFKNRTDGYHAFEHIRYVEAVAE